MKKILILGSGAGGTIVANNLRKRLSPKQTDKPLEYSTVIRR